jgi:putative radical SAM enzyme (TIGR03279 family)
VTTNALISSVFPGSRAERAGIKPGDRLLKVNGTEVRDLIDLSFLLAEDRVSLELLKAGGQMAKVNIRKKLDEDLGLEFESAVFDKVRTCANKCLFCFVDQMPEGMRESLYVKDDDYRLSFLYGNFVTLTNFTAQDRKRVRQFHLSPLYVSVHTTDADLRTRLLGIKSAGRITEQLRELAEEGIEFHTQVVLCPEVNDGDYLQKTIRELASLRPEALSLAIVPVGLTRFRQHCAPLRRFTQNEAVKIVASVQAWQQRFRLETGEAFVHLSDEMYLLAGAELPPEEDYDGYPQLENGVGLVRTFLTEWEAAPPVAAKERPAALLVSGTLFAPILKKLIETLPAAKRRSIETTAVVNRFFGSDVTVTGLLTGQDIIDHVKEGHFAAKRLILPGVLLRKGTTMLLDGLSVADIQAQTGLSVEVAHDAAQLKALL